MFFEFSQLKKLLHFDFLLAVLHQLDQADFFDFSVLDSYFLADQAFHSHCYPCSLFVDFSKSFWFKEGSSHFSAWYSKFDYEVLDDLTGSKLD